MRRLSIVSLLFMVSTLFLISPTHAATWTAVATKLDLKAGIGRSSAYLAPDGSGFAYFDMKSICMYTLTGEKGNCVALEGDIHPDQETVRWSPDSTKLAFSEDFFITYRDSDIWMYDVASNTLKDLTPTANRKLKLLSNTDPNVIYTVDVAPQWSADSQSIYFIRYEFNKTADAVPGFYSLKLGEDPPEKVVTPQTTMPFSVYGFALNQDETQIAYNLDTHNTEKDGTWFLDLASGKSKFAAAATEDTAPWTYQYSPDGKQLLVIGVDKKYGMGTREPQYSPYYTMPVAGGRHQNLNKDVYVFGAGWGQKDTMLAYTTVDQLHPENEGLYISSAPGQVGEMVLPGRYIVPVPRLRLPITWAANDTLLLSQGPEFNLVVVQLKQS